MALLRTGPRTPHFDLPKQPCPPTLHKLWSEASRPQFKSHLQPCDQGNITSRLWAQFRWAR